MPDLDMRDFKLTVKQIDYGFEYAVSFRFGLGGLYLEVGTAPSPNQCFDAAMVYLTEMMREPA